MLLKKQETEGLLSRILESAYSVISVTFLSRITKFACSPSGLKCKKSHGRAAERAEFRGENKFAQRPPRILSALRVTLFIFYTYGIGVTSLVHRVPTSVSRLT
jgi:hypothetical protein